MIRFADLTFADALTLIAWSGLLCAITALALYAVGSRGISRVFLWLGLGLSIGFFVTRWIGETYL